MKSHERFPAFLTRFILTALVGSGIIIALAPFIRPAAVPSWLEGFAHGVRAIPALDRTADRLSARLLWQRPAATSQTAAAAVPAPLPADPAWGVVLRPDTAVHHSAGDIDTRLPAGTAVRVVGSRLTTGGRFAQCRTASRTGSESAPFLLREEDLALYEGSLDRTPAALLEKAQRHARLQAEISRQRSRGTANDRPDNPHHTDLQQARQTFAAHQQEARDLARRFEQATGDQRMRLGEELRMHKPTEIQLKQALATAQNAYAAWNQANPAPAATADPRLATLEQELASLAAQLPPAGRLP